MTIKKSIVPFLLFTTFVGLGGYALNNTTSVVTEHFYVFLGFFVFITIASFSLAWFASKLKSPGSSLNLILLSFLFRLICSFLFYVSISSFTSDYSIQTASNFFVLYFLFTVFEIYYLVAILRADFKNTKTSENARQ